MVLKRPLFTLSDSGQLMVRNSGHFLGKSTSALFETEGVKPGRLLVLPLNA
jgi:hypothetical protein